MVRSLIKTGTACALRWTGTDKLIGVLTSSKNMPLVIGYHRVVEDIAANAGSSIPGMLISRGMLECHLDWIGRRFRFISLDELGSWLECGGKFDKPVAAITFDDGYSDVYYNAFPLLKQKGIPAAVFVVTDLVGTSCLQIYDKLYLLLTRAFSTWRSAPRDLARLLVGLGMWLPEIARMSDGAKNPYTAMRVLFNALPQAEIHRVIETLEAEVEIDESALDGLRPLSWEMLSKMYCTGMTIGSHTKTHALLTKESQQTVLEETAGSCQELERRLGITVKHFAYPDGRFNAATVSAVAASGYCFGYTTCLHRDPHYPLLTIPRKFLWQNSCRDALGHFSSAVMGCQVNGVFDFIARCRQDHEA